MPELSRKDIPAKIELARKIEKKMKETLAAPSLQQAGAEAQSRTPGFDFISKLTENIDKLELIYSDVIVKEHKTQSAASLMLDSERELEILLSEAGEYFSNREK